MKRTPQWIVGGAVAAAAALTLSGCGGSSFDDEAGAEQDGSAPLSILIGSSGDAETAAVKEAVAAWSEESGTDAEVTVASKLPEQLAQGFSSGKPADVFYLSTDLLAGYASNGSLLAYGDDLENKDDFYPTLVESFTYDGDFYCAPKDFSTLGLIINTDLWTQAGLTDADIPTTWEQLASVSQRLTTPEHAGLAFGGEYARVGAFMASAGGGLVSADGTEATANSDANVQALDYVKQQLAAGTFSYAKDVGAGWGGEAFGKGLAAMTIEGNWISGAMQNDFPDVKYRVAELPEGPGGKGTLQFTNCWGVATDSANQEAAVELVQHLTSTESQLAFASAFGVMPSIQSAAEDWKSENPDFVAFLDAADYAQGVPTVDGSADVITDFNAKLESLKSSEPKAILDEVQTNFEALLADAN